MNLELTDAARLADCCTCLSFLPSTVVQACAVTWLIRVLMLTEQMLYSLSHLLPSSALTSETILMSVSHSKLESPRPVVNTA